jgi:hypothetical protein
MRIRLIKIVRKIKSKSGFAMHCNPSQKLGYRFLVCRKKQGSEGGR